MPRKKRRAKNRTDKNTTIPSILSVLLIAATVVNIIWATSARSEVTNQGDRINSVDRMIASVIETNGGEGDKKDLTNVDLSSIKSTGHSIAVVFPVENIKTSDDAINMVIPTGTPQYGRSLGVTFDDPVNSLDVLVSTYRQIELSPEDQRRYLNLATKPVGISCEFCCGVGPVGITNDGKLMCGCKHNPAVHGLTKWMIQNTDYSDAEILREVMRWKALFFPKNMVELALTVAGGDTSSLDNLPSMIGGC